MNHLPKEITRSYKRVLLVQPPLTGEERYGALALGGNYMPPLGLACLASFLRKSGYEPTILDCESLQLHGEKAFQEIIKNKPDIVGFSAATLAIHRAGELAGEVKRRLHLPTIIGGVHVSALPEDTLERFVDFDFGVYGEGELTLVDLLDTLNYSKPLNNVPGLVYRNNGKVVKNPPRPFIADLDSLPFPAWDLLPHLTTHYSPSVFGFKRLPAMSLISSRGCPGQCSFCYNSLFGNKFRGHSAQYIIDMIRFLQKDYGIKEITIYDDTFVVNRKRLVEFCNLVITQNIDITWSANARVNLVDQHLLQLMKKAGCWSIGYGIESGDQKVLDKMRKNITLEQVAKVLQWTREAGIVSRGFFMVGVVYDSRESIQKTYEAIMTLPLDLITLNHFTPFPGSVDYEIALNSSGYSNDWRKLNQHSAEFIPEGLSRDEIEKFISVITRSFYLRPRTLMFFINLLKSPSHWKLLTRGMFAFLKFAFFRKK